MKRPYTEEFIKSKVAKKYHHMIDFKATIELQDGLFLVETPELRKVQNRFWINEAPSNWNWYVRQIANDPSYDW